MDFSLDGYRSLLGLLESHQYEFANYHDWIHRDRCVILRHDIDLSIDDSLVMARLERDLDINSTYFVLVTSDLYNAASKKNRRMLREIGEMGHEIGLHFDETVYDPCDLDCMDRLILEEAHILEDYIDASVTTVSMHRPSERILGSNLAIPGMENSYSSVFFNQFKYLSDSSMRWREPVEEIIESEEYDKLHILTHAFWYKGKSMSETLTEFINHANKDRYEDTKANLMNLEGIVDPAEVLF